MHDRSDEAQRHARLLAEKKGWWNPVLFQTERTWKSSLMHSSQYMVPRAQEPPHSLVLTDKEAILKRWAEHFDGVLNRPSSINDEAINRLPQVECNPLLDELPTVSKTVTATKHLSSGKAPYQMQYMRRSTKQEVFQLQRNWQSYFTLCGEKKPSLKNSRMQQLSTYSKGKGILRSVTIIEASLYCQLLGRSLLGSYWTDWMNTSNGQSFYQKASVDSGKTEEQ